MQRLPCVLFAMSRLPRLSADPIREWLLSSGVCILAGQTVANGMQVTRRMVNHVITAIETRGKCRRYLLLLQVMPCTIDGQHSAHTQASAERRLPLAGWLSSNANITYLKKSCGVWASAFASGSALARLWLPRCPCGCLAVKKDLLSIPTLGTGHDGGGWAAHPEQPEHGAAVHHGERQGPRAL